MDFILTDDQRMIQKTVREFAVKEIAPVAPIYDKSHEFPWDVIKKLAALNLLGILIPEKYGGAGLGYLSYAIVIEEISRYDASIGVTVAAHNSLGVGHIYSAGNEKQRKRYVTRLAKGEILGAWALTEPCAGSDAAGIETTAVKDGKEWVLNGTKRFITNGSVCGTVVVMAKTDPSKGARGISAFIVEKDSPGFIIGRQEEKLGLNASDTSELILDDCRIPEDNLLGKEGEGFIDTMKLLDAGRIGIAAMALGIAKGALEESTKYSKERVAFGHPIAEFEAIQWKIADMATEIEASRLLTFRAAFLKDRGENVTKEAAMAKLFSSEAGMRACSEAVQILGGYGYTKDFPVERYFRDVKLCAIGEGTSEIQRLVIARQILGLKR